MSAKAPHPEPKVSPLNHIHHIALPVHFRVGPRAGGRTYILWRAGECPSGEYAFAGIHTGA
eukprot:379473-Amphidinium_carterae.1